MKRVVGFTMVEMLAVLAVITILSLMALPSYLDKIVRAQIESSMSLADVAKKPIAEAWKALHDFPATNTDILLPVADKIVGNYVTSVAVENGVIHMTFGNQASGAIKGKILSFRPAVVADEPVVPVAWVCGYAPTPAKMTVIGNDKTNIPQELLPRECLAQSKKAG